jgi:hypothetical protein
MSSQQKDIRKRRHGSIPGDRRTFLCRDLQAKQPSLSKKRSCECVRPTTSNEQSLPSLFLLPRRRYAGERFASSSRISSSVDHAESPASLSYCMLQVDLAPTMLQLRKTLSLRREHLCLRCYTQARALSCVADRHHQPRWS